MNLNRTYKYIENWSSWSSLTNINAKHEHIHKPAFSKHKIEMTKYEKIYSWKKKSKSSTKRVTTEFNQQVKCHCGFTCITQIVMAAFWFSENLWLILWLIFYLDFMAVLTIHSTWIVFLDNPCRQIHGIHILLKWRWKLKNLTLKENANQTSVCFQWMKQNKKE